MSVDRDTSAIPDALASPRQVMHTGAHCGAPSAGVHGPQGETRMGSTHTYQSDPRNADIQININGELFHRDRAMVSVFDSGPPLLAESDAYIVWGLFHKYILQYLVYAILGAHILGALKHHYVDKEKHALKRMVG